MFQHALEFAGRNFDYKDIGLKRSWVSVDFFLFVEAAKTLPVFEKLLRLTATSLVNMRRRHVKDRGLPLENARESRKMTLNVSSENPREEMLNFFGKRCLVLPYQPLLLAEFYNPRSLKEVARVQSYEVIHASLRTALIQAQTGG